VPLTKILPSIERVRGSEKSPSASIINSEGQAGALVAVLQVAVVAAASKMTRASVP
jgi:hypothetical protein